MADDYEAAMQDFHVMLGECTLKTYCGRDYVLVLKFKEWLRELHSGPWDMQVARLHQAAYRNWHRPAPPISAEQICEENCLLIFSILLEMKRGELIHEICKLGNNDRHLPIDLYTLKTRFSGLKIRDFEAVAEEFDRRQWKYCPAILKLGGERQYLENLILPFRRRVKINDKGGTAQLWQIEVLEEFVDPKLRKRVEESRFDCNDGLGPRYEFALKAFEDGNMRVFENERDAFHALAGNSAMVQYFGSYSHKEREYEETDGTALPDGRSTTNPQIIVPKEQGAAVRATHNIILEFGESDLEEYFAEYQPPAFQPEVEAFWSGLVEVADAVKGIHNLETNNGGRVQQFYGWHADIKPDNILIVHGKFKLADPGFVKFVKKTSIKPKEVQNGGTETYGAPERHDGWEENPSEVDQSIDTWSLACVFSIAATWVVLGYQGIRQFSKLREKAILTIKTQQAKLPKHQRTRPCLTTDSFHDGLQVLTAVTEWHKFLRNALRGTDTITRRILDLVDQRMLLRDPKTRIETEELCEELKKIIKQGKEERRIPVPMSIQSLLQEVDAEAPQPSKSQLTMSIPSATSLAPATIARARKSKFLGPALQKTAHRSQVLRTILEPEKDTTPPFNDSYPLQAGASRAAWLENDARDRMPPPNSKATIPNSQASQRHSLPYSMPDSTVVTGISRPRAPKRAQTIPYQSVFQAREENEQVSGKKKKDPLLSKYFDKRDIKFLVDNAGTMKPFWREATELLETLVKKARGQDENGMDLFFTSGRIKVEGKEAKGKVYKAFKDDPFLAAMKNPDAVPSPGHQTDITKSLGDVFADYTDARRKRPSGDIRNLTLIVFTDGRWDALKNKEEVKILIVKFVKSLNSLIGDFRKRPVSIEFVQFGDDPDASHRLWSLDNELKYAGIPDIIDTEHSSGNIIKMLLGSFNPAIDGDDEDDDDQTMTASPTRLSTEFGTFSDSNPTQTSTYMTSAQASRTSTMNATPRSTRLEPQPESSIFSIRRSSSRKRDSRKA